MREIHILNHGLGVQTTTLDLMAREGLIVPDFEVRIGEGVKLYKHRDWLMSLPGPKIHVRTAGKLHEHLKSGTNSTSQRFASIPCFTSNWEYAEEAKEQLKSAKDPQEILAIMIRFAETVNDPSKDESEIWFDEDDDGTFQASLVERWNGSIQRMETTWLSGQIDKWTQYGQFQRQCTKEYKVDVIDRFIRREILGLPPGETVPKDVLLIHHIGISLDEIGRTARIRKRFAAKPRTTVRFDLIEREMTRKDCVEFLASRGVKYRLRSACVFCPYHDDIEWQSIKEEPEDWELSCETDENLRRPGIACNRKARQKFYLHRSCRPLRSIDFSNPPRPALFQSGLFQECEGMCGN